MNNKNIIVDSVRENESNTFLDLREILFKELTEDVVVEIADLIGVPHEIVLSKKYTFLDSDLKKEEELEEEKAKNKERLTSLLKSGDPCCANNCFKDFDEKSLMNFADNLDSCSKSETECGGWRCAGHLFQLGHFRIILNHLDAPNQFTGQARAVARCKPHRARFVTT